jgi:hypothetical protein
MSRLIEIEPSQDLPTSLNICVGDLLKFWACGGRVESGAEACEMLGPFLTGVLGTNEELLSPQGAPNVIMFLARRPGQATIDIITGDPWHATQTATLKLNIGP